MRRVLVYGLIVLASVAVLFGVRHQLQQVESLQAAAAASAKPIDTSAEPDEPAVSPRAPKPWPRSEAGFSVLQQADKTPMAPIPQDPEAIKKRRDDMLAWNRRTLGEAYEKVGKKDPRWDEPARKAFDLAARHFSLTVDPQVTYDEIYKGARAAVDAGCDDPLLAYVYARTSVGENYPGEEELIRRAQAAAKGLAASQYPAFRRAVALRFSGEMALAGQNPSEENREAARRDFDAALALIEESVAKDEHNAFWEANWDSTLLDLIRGHRTLGAPPVEAYNIVDAGLERVAGAKYLRLLLRGKFWLTFGWEARTIAFAPDVPKGGFETMEKRLAIAKKALKEAWEVEPDSIEVPQCLMEIDKGVGGDRETMELWFDRAIKANGDDRMICFSKLDWLDPKWHGTAEEMIAFGRACRDTKNSRTGITLLVADAHYRLSTMLGNEKSKYLAMPEVWADISSVYDEYLKHHPTDDLARSKYATFCYESGHYRQAEVQYVILGDRLMQWSEIPYLPLATMKEIREKNAKILMNKAKGFSFKGWHYRQSKTDEGEWHIQAPEHVDIRQKPGLLGGENQTWGCDAAGMTYEFRVIEIPDSLRDKGPEAVLDAARDEVAKQFGGEPRDQGETMLAARPARQFSIDATRPISTHMRFKSIVLGRRVYLLSVAGSQKRINGHDANEFFDAFSYQPIAK
ncbi:hypothetical protein [Singulisphaera sp. PoT]|uniref:hypothetical protein n=1 Tax=Singulisphaera sp. PoT TaxID=3411797 RepID=UPI003BF55A3B